MIEAGPKVCADAEQLKILSRDWRGRERHVRCRDIACSFIQTVSVDP
jgi:hypothetical protein